jgi:hypothetical protein
MTWNSKSTAPKESVPFILMVQSGTHLRLSQIKSGRSYEGVSKLGRVKEVDEQIPSDAATQYRTVGGSQWMLALNYI